MIVLHVLRAHSSLFDSPSSGVMQVTMQIIHQDGFPGLFRGMVPTLIREVPGYFFFFGGYELSRYLLTPKGKTVDEIGEYLSLVYT